MPLFALPPVASAFAVPAPPLALRWSRRGALWRVAPAAGAHGTLSGGDIPHRLVHAMSCASSRSAGSVADGQEGPPATSLRPRAGLVCCCGVRSPRSSSVPSSRERERPSPQPPCGSGHCARETVSREELLCRSGRQSYEVGLAWPGPLGRLGAPGSSRSAFLVVRRGAAAAARAAWA